MLMSNHFYHSITKKAVIAFGSLFNDMYVSRYNSDGSEKERVKVPLFYMTKQKFLTRILANPDLLGSVSYSIPAMSFEFNLFSFDASRKNDTFQKTLYKKTNGDYLFRYGRTPYNVTFVLNVFSKNTEDVLQILEQILPWFNPEYSVNIKMLDPTDMSVDVPFVIQNINYDENVEETDLPESDRKLANLTIEFTCKLFYYGPLQKLDAAATGATQGIGDSYVPKGMIGKVITTTRNMDNGMAFESILVGVTGGANPETFDPSLSSSSDQTYIVYSKYF